MDEALSARTTTITGAGGDQIEAYLAVPDDDLVHAGVVVIHHMPGYDAETKEITRRLAAGGLGGLCPNLYSREATTASYEEAAAVARSLGGVPDDRLVGDVAAAAEHLKAIGRASGRVGVLGFCSGGRQALVAACSLSLDAAVDCYGAFVLEPPPSNLGLLCQPIPDLLSNLSCPLLGIFGAEDTNPSPDEVKRLSEALTELGKDFEFETYENAGHAFLATDRPNYRPEAATRAWARIMAFFNRTLEE